MSYQVLARKWRPASFGEMTGQQHVLRALVNALDNDRLHHAYLFTGTRGVGKTTVARILAKCLNCEQGVSAQPCGECASCVEIAEGRSVDLLEVDAASRTKVEDTRDLLDNVQYAPTRSRYKIYLIDEVHMLSTHSFNALLKTLEEPPPHAKFLLATTDPQKLPATILSRCLQFNLKNMLPAEIVSRLDHILTAESIDFDQPSLQLIARAAEGSMRDALSLTDQAIAFAGGRLEQADVRSMLGTVDRGRVLSLAEAVIAGAPATVLEQVASVAEHAPDYAATLDELAAVLHQVTIAQMVPEGLDSSSPDHERIVALAGAASIDDIQLCYQFAVSGRSELALASDPRVGLEMLLLRMIAFRPGVVIGDAMEAPPAKKPEPPVLPVEQPTVPSRPAPAPPPVKVATPRSLETPSAQPVASAKAPTPADLPSTEPAQPSATAEVGMPTTESWPELYEALELRGLLGSVALNTELHHVSGTTLYFVLDANNATLYNPRQLTMLEQALSEHLGIAVTAELETGQVGTLTPAVRRARLAAERLAAAESALTADQRLQSLIDEFDGEIIPGSIRPPNTEQRP